MEKKYYPSLWESAFSAVITMNGGRPADQEETERKMMKKEINYA